MMKLNVFQGTLAVAVLFLVGCTQNPYTVEIESSTRKSVQETVAIDAHEAGQQEARKKARTAVEKGKVGNPSNTRGRSLFNSTPKPYPTNAAVLALMERAKASGYHGDYQSAEVSLERALRISPKNIKLYRMMVELKIQKGDMQLAVEIARKGLSIAKGRVQLEEQRRLQALLSQIKRQ